MLALDLVTCSMTTNQHWLLVFFLCFPMSPTPHKLIAFSVALLALPLIEGCAVASATAGAAISITGAVVSTGIKVTGAVVEAGIDAVSDDDGDD